MASIMTSYIFKIMEVMFQQSIYREIFRDDRLVIFLGKWSKKQIMCWICQYKILVDKIVWGLPPIYNQALVATKASRESQQWQ
eukprot:15366010-Ditylum_brightwellii.AAC.1